MLEFLSGQFKGNIKYQWVPGVQNELSGAVADSRRDACCAVHGAHYPPLPCFFCLLYKLNGDPELSKTLYPGARHCPFLPQPVPLVVGDSCREKEKREQMRTFSILRDVLQTLKMVNLVKINVSCRT